MKDFDLNGITFLQPVPWGTDEWYYALDHPCGDLYEAEELYQDGRLPAGSRLILLHYPDGSQFRPLPPEDGVAIGEPVYYDGRISFPAVDFPAGKILLYGFHCRSCRLTLIAELPLSEVEDCYNLRLHEHPLTLSRQPNDGALELIWPVRARIPVTDTESFFWREDERLYFSRWYEDPDYREEIVVRDAASGQILEQFPGDIHVMPDGQLWHLY